MWQEGSIPANGFISANPFLEPDNQGVSHITAGSPAIGAGNGRFPFVNIDIDGQPRGPVRDTGADQYANSQVSNHPLTITDVGPGAVSMLK